MNCSQCLLSLPFVPADHRAGCFQEITLFNSQNHHRSLESLGSTAGVWGMGTGIQVQVTSTSVYAMLPPHGQKWFWANSRYFSQGVIKASLSLLTYKSPQE